MGLPFYKMGITIPDQGGNIVLLTQLWWPLVHPAMQEKRVANSAKRRYTPGMEFTPTPEQVAEFETWKGQWQKLTQQGWDNGWLETDYDSDTQPIDSAPRNIVYDESAEAYEARLSAWQESVRGQQVTFPIANRGGSVSAVEPDLKADPDA